MSVSEDRFNTLLQEFGQLEAINSSLIAKIEGRDEEIVNSSF